MRIVVAGKGPAWEYITETSDVVPVASGEPLVEGEVLVSVQYDRIVKPDQIDSYGQAFNIHYGTLPQYRGCFPTKWAIINGDPIGVTFHYMTPGVDEGPVIFQWSYPSTGLTDGEAYEKCNEAAVIIWNAYHPRILSGEEFSAYPQDETKAVYYPRQLPYGGLRDNVPSHLLERAERAYTHPGYPGLA